LTGFADAKGACLELSLAEVTRVENVMVGAGDPEKLAVASLFPLDSIRYFIN